MKNVFYYNITVKFISAGGSSRDVPQTQTFEKVASDSQVGFGQGNNKTTVPRREKFQVRKTNFWRNSDKQLAGVLNRDQLGGKVCVCSFRPEVDRFVEVVGKLNVAAIIVSKHPNVDCAKPVFCLPEAVVNKLSRWCNVDIYIEEIQGMKPAMPNDPLLCETNVDAEMKEKRTRDNTATRSYVDALKANWSEQQPSPTATSVSGASVTDGQFEDAPDDKVSAKKVESNQRTSETKQSKRSSWGGLGRLGGYLVSSVSSLVKGEPELMKLFKAKNWSQDDNHEGYQSAIKFVQENGKEKCDDETVTQVVDWLKNNSAGPMRLAVCMEIWHLVGERDVGTQLFNEIVVSLAKMNISEKRAVGLMCKHSKFLRRQKPHRIVGQFFSAMVLELVARGGKQAVADLLETEASMGSFWVATLFYWNDSGMLVQKEVDWEFWEHIRVLLLNTFVGEHKNELMSLIDVQRANTIALLLQPSHSQIHDTFFDLPHSVSLESHVTEWIIKLAGGLVKKHLAGIDCSEEWQKVFVVLSEACPTQLTDGKCRQVLDRLARLASYDDCQRFKIYSVIAAGSQETTLYSKTLFALCECLRQDLMVCNPQIVSDLSSLLQSPFGSQLMQGKRVLLRVVNFAERSMQHPEIEFGGKLRLLTILHAEMAGGNHGTDWSRRKYDVVVGLLIEALPLHSCREKLEDLLLLSLSTMPIFEGCADEVVARTVDTFSSEDVLGNIRVVTTALLRLAQNPSGSFGFCLCSHLRLALVGFCSSFDRAAVVLLDLAFDENPTRDTQALVRQVISKTFNQWKPTSLIQLSRLKGMSIDLCARCFQVNTTLHPMFNFKEHLLRLVMEWISRFEAEAVLLRDLEEGKLCAASPFWVVLETHWNNSKMLPSLDDIVSKIKDLEELVGSILESLAASPDWNCSLVDLLKAYDWVESEGSEFERVIATYCPISHENYQTSFAPEGLDDATMFLHVRETVALQQLREDALVAESLRSSYWHSLSICDFFLQHKSKIFEGEIGQLLDGQVDLEDLSYAVDSTLESIQDLFSPGCDFEVFKKSLDGISMAEGVLEHECSVLLKRPECGLTDEDVNRFLIVASFMQIEGPLSEFLNFCEQMKFKVIQDELFSVLKTLVASLVSSSSSDPKVEVVHGLCLQLDSTLHPDCGDCSQDPSTVLTHLRRLRGLFTFLGSFSHHGEVWVFSRDNKWLGKEGLDQFYLEFENVTNITLGNHKDSFYMTVLDALEPTVRVISALGGLQSEESVPSMLEKISSNSDMSRWMENGGHDNLKQVQGSLSLLRGWFCDGVDENAKIGAELKSIQRSGVFSICLSPKLSLQLQYTLATNGTMEDRCAADEELDDLVERMGMIQHDDPADARAVEGFLNQHRVMMAARSNFAESYAVGYPLPGSEAMSCSAGHEYLDEAMAILKRSQTSLKEKDSWLDSTRSRYPTSMLFWTKELKQIYDILGGAQDETVLRRLMAILSRLDSSLTRDQVSSIALQHMGHLKGDEGWLVITSKFVEDVHQAVGAPFEQKERNEVGVLKLHTLSCDAGCESDATLGLLQNIYKNRLPAEFEILFVSPETEKEEVDLFLRRSKVFTTNIFTIVNVDKMAGNSLEKVLDFTSDRENKSLGLRLHLIQAKTSMLHTSSFLEGSEWRHCATEDQSSCWRNIINGERCQSVSIVLSEASGAGKTRLIRREIKRRHRDKAVGAITVHEGSMMDSLTDDIIDAFKLNGSKKAIHFSFMCLLEPSSEVNCAWLDTINRFFFSFLVLGLIRNSDSSKSFHVGNSGWTIYVELPSMLRGGNGETAVGATQEWLRKHVPVLSICGEVRQPEQRFSVDDATRRVCTYLRAYEDGTIDRKFKPGSGRKKLVFVLDNSGSMAEIVGNDKTALSAAVDCALEIFDSHLNQNDMAGVVLFNQNTSIQVPIQVVTDEHHKAELRNSLDCVRFSAGGGTRMYPALQYAVEDCQRTHDEDMETWIICLTDGCTGGTDETFRPCLENSCDNVHVILIGVNLPLQYGQRMQLLCNKYQDPPVESNKGQYIASQANIESLVEAFQTVARAIPVSQTFELDGQVSDGECGRLIHKYAPDSVPRHNMQKMSFWVSFLYRRVSVLDSNENYNYNETVEHLGSSLMTIMLFEVQRILDKDLSLDWVNTNHTQLIYDFENPEAPEFRLLCTSPRTLDPVLRQRYESLNLPGFFVPSEMQLQSPRFLCELLSKALDIPVSGSDCLNCVNNEGFIITVDFALKMLCLAERVSCRCPAILEGETGVSKTALTKMYSKLLNLSHILKAARLTALDLDDIEQEIQSMGYNVDDGHIALDRLERSLESAAERSREGTTELSELLYTLLTKKIELRPALFQDKPDKFDSNQTQAVLEMLKWFGSSLVEPTFFSINVDATLSGDDISKLFIPVRQAARKLMGENCAIIVFLDEVNTSSVIGLFKEIVVDRSLHGEVLEGNIIPVAACNPVRTAAKVATKREHDMATCWASGHYQVVALPPSMEDLKWSFGSLNAAQEREFISRRLEMTGTDKISPGLRMSLTDLISSCQDTIRRLAARHLCETVFHESQPDDDDLQQRAASVVSLRDIQRVFTLYGWFLDNLHLLDKEALSLKSSQRTSMVLSVAIVYYMRLDAGCRRGLLAVIENLPGEKGEKHSFRGVLESSMETVIRNSLVPPGIAVTMGLKENLFVTLVCTLSCVPLLMVGRPGSSKTLSVNMLADNATGEDSSSPFYRALSRLSLFHYQCSKETSSREIAAIFRKASQRQEKLDPSKQRCVVFMDEAGLPEEDRESLKVLHYLLESCAQKAAVGFVAIANHILDAAKSNRCAVLLRPEPDEEEMATIASGLLYCKTTDGTIVTREVCVGDTLLPADKFARQVCTSYDTVIKGGLTNKDAHTFYGLRDFIYFLRSVKANARETSMTKLHISIRSLVQAIERNFNGLEKRALYETIVVFLKPFCNSSEMRRIFSQIARDPLEIIRASLEQNCACVDQENRARFAMFIDSSEDDSIMRLLHLMGLLEDSKRSLFKLSHMPDESALERMRLISGVKFAAGQGKAALLSQTEPVNEAFYDITNQQFRMVKDRDGQQLLFTNIAVGGVSRRSQVNPSFECIVHARSSQIKELPAPYLNRFEKFQLDIKDVIVAGLTKLGPGMASVIQQARSQTLLLLKPLIEHYGLFGWAENERTLDGVFIDMLPAWALQGDKPSFVAEEEDSFADVMAKFLKVASSLSVAASDIMVLVRISKKHLPEDQAELLGLLEDGEVAVAELQLALRSLLAQPSDGVLDNFCKSVVQMIMTRYAVNTLLQLATPESVFAQRHALPADVFEWYLESSGHCSLQELIQTELENLMRPKMIVAYSRTDACNLSIATLSKGQNDVVVERLELLRSEAKVRGSVLAWIQHDEKRVYVLVVDMKGQKSVEQCNYIRMLVESHLSNTTNKIFVLLLHYPPSTFLKSSWYPALSLGGWSHFFLDGMDQVRGLGTNQFMRLSCEIEDAQESDLVKNLLGFLEQMLPTALSTIACRQPFPRTGGGVDPFNDQLEQLAQLFSQKVGDHTVQEVLCKKFAREWMEEALPYATKLASRALLEGTTQLSMNASIHRSLEKAFESFLLLHLGEILAGRNYEVITNGASEEVRQLFGKVLESLPAVPFEEILLQQDSPSVNRQRRADETETIPRFPFFNFISSALKECIEIAEKEILMKQKGGRDKHRRACKGKALLETCTEIMDNLKDGDDTGSHRASLILDVVGSVVSSEDDDLFKRYLQEFVQNRTGCTANSVAVDWLDSQTRDLGGGQRSILAMHCFQRERPLEIMRIVPWSKSMQFAEPENALSGWQESSFATTCFLRMLEHFETTLVTCADSNWRGLLSSFVAQLNMGLVDDRVLERQDVRNRIRVLVGVLGLLRVGVPNIPSVVSTWYDEDLSLITVSAETDLSIGSIMSMLSVAGAPKDTLQSFLWQFFNYAKIMPYHFESDLGGLLALLNGELCDQQFAMALLHKACSAGATDNDLLLGWSKQTLKIVNNAVPCQRLREFSSSGVRTCVPHFVPEWLQSASTIDGEESVQTLSVYPEFFADYEHSFDDGAFPNAMYQLLLCMMLGQSGPMSSLDLLILLLKDIEAEAGVDSTLDTTGDQYDSLAGSPLGAMIADCRILCFLTKVAQELAQHGEASALSGPDEIGMTVLGQIMSLESIKFKDFFFSVMSHHGGESSVAASLRQGGQLHGQPWCRSLQNGVPSERGRVETELATAQRNLNEMEQEEQRKANEIRLCPHCGAQFMVDAVECGTMRCGQDAHRDNGRPLVGGNIVNGGYGCGRQFPLDQAGRYQFDDEAIRQLRQEVSIKAAQFRGFTGANEKWNAMISFEVPKLRFVLRREKEDSHLLTAAVFDETDVSDYQSCLLQILMDGSGFSAEISILPDLIEFYLWLHSHFAHLITKEEALSNTIGSILDKARVHKRFDRIHASHILALFERLSCKFDVLLKDPKFRVTWQCEEVQLGFKTLKEAPLLALLSEGADPSEGNDVLFLWIDTIVAKYNRFVQRLAELASNDAVAPTRSIHPSMVLPDSASIITLPLLQPEELGSLAMASWQGDTKTFDSERLDSLLRKGIVHSDLPPLISNPLDFLREHFSFRVDQSVEKKSTAKHELVFSSSSGLLFCRQEDLRLLERAQGTLRRLGVVGADESILGPIRVHYSCLDSQTIATLLSGIQNFFDLLLSDGVTRISCMREAIEMVNFTMEFDEFLGSLGFPLLNQSQWKLLIDLDGKQIFSLVQFLGYQLATEGFIYRECDRCAADPLNEDTKNTLVASVQELCLQQGTKSTLADVESFTNDVLLQPYYKDLIVEKARKSPQPLRSVLVEADKYLADEPVLGCIPVDVTVRNYVSLMQVLHQVRLSLRLQPSEDNFAKTADNDDNVPGKQSIGCCWLWNGEELPDRWITYMSDTQDEDDAMRLWFISESDVEQDDNRCPNEPAPANVSPVLDGESGEAVSDSTDLRIVIAEDPAVAEEDPAKVAAAQIQRWWRDFSQETEATRWGDEADHDNVSTTIQVSSQDQKELNDKHIDPADSKCAELDESMDLVQGLGRDLEPEVVAKWFILSVLMTCFSALVYAFLCKFKCKVVDGVLMIHSSSS
ncbi:protein ligase RNF213 [Seminavis robusta]|uniref:Protein ligase RNF213 n=1 Tax=Seminavis robusta TaxID=568900 RepID=A0A9N8HHZ2_9STRA|nr:protein ligase RNF213 [Seminavis robusta]|eukprot:Sro592_g172130.1 protein ligase RNF213 (5103) ;mRNA; f:15124-30753